MVDGMNPIDGAVRLGTLLLTPPDVGERARDVLCVLDVDHDAAGACFALILNRPTGEPAQPLAFSLFDCGDDVLWWGGPTNEPFALVEFDGALTPPDTARPDGSPRPLLTDRVAVYVPGRDHVPSREPKRVRVFVGSVWLSAHDVQLFLNEGTLSSATADDLFDPEPETAAERLRARAAGTEENPGMPAAGKASARSTPLHRYYNVLKEGLDEGEQTALAETHAENPSPLVRRLRQSVAAFTEPIEEPFHPSGKADPKERRTPVDEIKKTIEFAAHICDGRTIAVENADQLAFRYVDREISPLRTKLAEEEDRSPRRSLDLLLANAHDGRPIFAELKIGGDRPTCFALVQLLALASDLLPRPQLERLDEQYRTAQFAWADGGPFADLYIIAFKPPTTGKYRKRSFDATEGISKKLIDNREVSSLVRRIAYLEAEPRGNDLVFRSLFAFPEGL
jgi:hypothetical protein